jgi:GSCFA family
VLTIGSCFSDSIGARLADFKVATMVNPFGTVFNPISLCRLLRAAAGDEMDWQQHIVEARGRWQSYDLHAEVGADTPVELLQHIQSLTREVGVFLATADAVVLTLGSAFAYRLRETGEIVSNCHKIPADKFDKELLTADDIIAAVAETHAYLRRINPRLQIILTVSPVRHIKDTLVLNSTSKSMLRVACHYLSELLPDVTYFPAYELLVDDLRDYRFYAADMLHPSDVAENYIWERFTRTYFDAAFGRFKKEWESLRQALGHRPLYAAAPEHRQFLETTLERLRKLSAQADVQPELLHLERELAALPHPPALTVPEQTDEDEQEERIDIGEFAEESSSQAALVGHGRGVLIESDDQIETEDNEDEPVETAEAAYEYAYSAEVTTEETEEEPLEEEITGEPARRRKRRSRGGAKRTKRKHARLAAEAAATATSEQVLTAEPTTVPASAEAASDITSATPELAPSLPETADNEATGGPRRARNSRRNRRDRPARSEGRTSRAPLYATDPSEMTAAETFAESTASELVETTAAPQLPTAPVEPALEPVQPLLPEEATLSATPSRPKRPAASRSRKKPTAAPPPDTLIMPVPTETAPLADVPPISPVQELSADPADALVPPVTKARSRRKAALAKSAAAPESMAASESEPVAAVEAEAPATEPQSTEKPAAKKPAAPRKRAPRKSATTAADPGPVVASASLPATEPKPEAPQRKPRPSRRKAAPDAPTSENS